MLAFRLTNIAALLLSLWIGSPLLGQAPPQSSEEVSKAYRDLEGDWKMTSFQGRPVIGSSPRARIRFSDEGVDLGQGVMRFDLDTTKVPKQINVFVPFGKKEIQLPGIYKIDGEDLQICLAASKPPKGKQPPIVGKRPSKFEVNESFLWIAKRMEPPKRPLASIGIPKTGRYLNHGVAAVTPDSSMGVFRLGDYFVKWDLQQNKLSGRINLPPRNVSTTLRQLFISC